MRERLALLFLLLPALVISMSARESELMYTPAPIEVPKGTDPGDVPKAIQAALAGRGWSMDKESVPDSGGAGEIIATLNVRVHTVTIRFEFDAGRIQIHYVSTTNMGYKESKSNKLLIHPKYTQWLKNLEKGLKDELLRMRK